MREQSVNFDRIANKYDETRGFPEGVPAQVAKFIHEIGQLSSTHTILEIGVGTGRIALPLAKHVGKYYGIDISEGMLQYLRNNHTQQPLFVNVGDAEKLPFPNNSFDSIVIVHVLHLVRDPKPVADELARVLKPDGVILNGFGGHSDAIKPLQEVWSQAKKTYRDKPPTFNSYDILPNLGWEQIGDIHTMSYPITQSPSYFLEQIKARSWSSTWDVTDEDLNVAVAELEAVIEKRYDDPNIEIPSEGTFNLQILHPPQP